MVNKLHPQLLGRSAFFNFALSTDFSLQLGTFFPHRREARTVKHSTIKLYLAAVRNQFFWHGDPFLGKLLRYQGRQTRILQQPVTPRVLLGIRPILRLWLGERYLEMNWADFTSPLIVEHTHLNVVCLVEFWQYLFFPITTTFNKHVFFAL